MKDLFRYFIKKNYPEISDEISNEDIDEIGIEFHKYLENKLSKEQQEEIIPKDVMKVILQSDHPFKTNGFEPAYVLHFIKWIEQECQTDLEKL